MTRDYPHRYPSQTPSTSTEQLVHPPPPHTPAASAQYHGREPSLGSTAPASSGRNRSAPGVLPGPYHNDHGDTSSHGSTRRNMILGWLMGKKTTDPRSGRPFELPHRQDVHGFRHSYRDASRSSNDVSGFSRDISGVSTDQTRLSQSKNSSSHPRTSVDSSILRDRYTSDSTMPSSVIKTDSTLLATDKTSFATDQEIFGALASKISSKSGSVTGKDNFSMSSRAASTVGSTSPIIDGEDVASPEQAKQLMEKGFRQYRHCCGRCTFCKLLVMAAFLGILGLMSYGAVVGVRGALGYGSVSAQVGDEDLANTFDNETINDMDLPLMPDPGENLPPDVPSKTLPPLHRTTLLRNGQDGSATPPPNPPPPFVNPNPTDNRRLPAPAPPPVTPVRVIVPTPVKFVHRGVQVDECVTEVTTGRKVNEPLCRQSPNVTIGGRFSCSTYLYCVDEQGYQQYECPCDQYFHPPSLTCVPQVNGIYSDPDDCTKYWHCEVRLPTVHRTEFHCDDGTAMDIIEPGECRRSDSVSYCGRA